jgi:hypothetical protein
MTATDLKKLYIALFMMMGFRLLVISYVWMLPTLDEFKEVQQRLAAMNAVDQYSKRAKYSQ